LLAGAALVGLAATYALTREPTAPPPAAATPAIPVAAVDAAVVALAPDAPATVDLALELDPADAIVVDRAGTILASGGTVLTLPRSAGWLDVIVQKDGFTPQTYRVYPGQTPKLAAHLVAIAKPAVRPQPPPSRPATPPTEKPRGTLPGFDDPK
jgi:hypothetical protein